MTRCDPAGYPHRAKARAQDGSPNLPSPIDTNAAASRICRSHAAIVRSLGLMAIVSSAHHSQREGSGVEPNWCKVDFSGLEPAQTARGNAATEMALRATIDRHSISE